MANSSGESSATVAASGKRWVTGPVGASSGLPAPRDEPPGKRARPGDRDLLADHRADDELEAVRVTRHPQAGPARGRSGRRTGSRRSAVAHARRVGVEVEQATGPGDRGGEVALIVESERADDVIRRRGQGHDAVAVRERERSAVCAVDHRLDADDGPGTEELDEAGTVEGRTRPRAEPSPSRAPDVVGADARSALGIRREHLAHRVVELADAREPGRERDIGDAQIRGLDQHPRRLRALRPRERERARADLGDEQPVDLTLAVREPRREPTDAVPVDDAVGDQAHGPRHDVAARIPLG